MRIRSANPNIKQELIENVYSSQSQLFTHHRTTSAKSKRISASKDTGEVVKSNKKTKGHIKLEELMQDNMVLKSTINKLV